MESKKEPIKADAPTPEKVDYKIIKAIGKNSLIEYVVDGVAVRVVMPRKKSYTKKDLDKGVPQSVRWDQVKLSFDAKTFCANMQKRGYWTKEDVQNDLMVSCL